MLIKIQLKSTYSRISRVIPSFKGGIPSDEMIEFKYRSSPNARRHYYGKENDR